MRALSVMQPWATLLVRGIKPLENRSWRPALEEGERFLVHAGARQASEEEVEALLPDEAVKAIAGWRTWPRGAIVGEVVFGGCFDPDKIPEDLAEWHDGKSRGWLIQEARELRTPIPRRGQLQLWKVRDYPEAPVFRGPQDEEEESEILELAHQSEMAQGRIRVLEQVLRLVLDGAAPTPATEAGRLLLGLPCDLRLAQVGQGQVLEELERRRKRDIDQAFAQPYRPWAGVGQVPG